MYSVEAKILIKMRLHAQIDCAMCSPSNSMTPVAGYAYIIEKPYLLKLAILHNVCSFSYLDRK